jgi:hypothetical protein
MTHPTTPIEIIAPCDSPFEDSPLLDELELESPFLFGSPGTVGVEVEVGGFPDEDVSVVELGGLGAVVWVVEVVDVWVVEVVVVWVVVCVVEGGLGIVVEVDDFVAIRDGFRILNS